MDKVRSYKLFRSVGFTRLGSALLACICPFGHEREFAEVVREMLRKEYD